MIEFTDDDLIKFEANGAKPLPTADAEGFVENANAHIYYASYGSGPPVILLHGGLGHGGNWAHQVPAFLQIGFRAVLVDSRGHGRSTCDAQPYSYELMVSDVLAVMDALQIRKAALVGWSDGACTALILAAKSPSRVAGVFYFACNMDPTGTKPFESTPTLNRCFARHTKDYTRLSATPAAFKDFVASVTLMEQTQPNFSAEDLEKISVPVVIAQSEHDEFIKREHAEYLARTIPGAQFVLLKGVSHFAPLQRPGQFNKAMVTFVEKVLMKENGE